MITSSELHFVKCIWHVENELAYETQGINILTPEKSANFNINNSLQTKGLRPIPVSNHITHSDASNATG